MSKANHLLTIIVEDTGSLDYESTMYRRLLAGRLELEEQYSIEFVPERLDTSRIRKLCEGLNSTYVAFMRSSHQISADYVKEIVDRLSAGSTYLAEPYSYLGNIPKNLSATKLDKDYHYARDTDIFGVAFNRRRLLDSLEAFHDLDMSSLYIAYRLYWDIREIAPVKTGYSVSSATKAATGIELDSQVTRLMPFIRTGSKQLRIYIFRQLVLFLRGLRQTPASSITLTHLREITRYFSLGEFIPLAETLHPFEAAWVRWLLHPAENQQIFKQLTHKDTYLVFSEPFHPAGADLNLYDILLGDEIISIGRSYLPHDIRPGYHNPGTYDFYGHPITQNSTILFFDRPMQADDNAEHLYSYFLKNYPDYKKAYFALNPKSKDWNRLRMRGFRLIPIFSESFYETFLVSDLVVSSQIYNIHHRGKTFANSRFVYLQHGIQLNDMTNWILSKYFDVFVATGELEADYISNLAPVETLNSGIPRLETLYHRHERKHDLLFMPTWRFNLHNVSTEQFMESDYYQAIDGVLTDRSLHDYLEQTDRVLRIKLHPNVEKRSDLFHFSPRVQLSTENYGDAISTASFVFTDYSSAVLDASFINTPISYFQWDAPEFFFDQPYESRLDYTTQGLGPTFFKLTDLISYIVSEDFLREDEEYARRKQDFFKGVNPEQINRTIIERMLSL